MMAPASSQGGDMLFTIVLALLTTFIAVLSTTVYLHRAATHGALKLHPIVSEGFKFSTWLTTSIKPAEWVAVHRLHHRFTDRPGDPHSPKQEGFAQIQWLNVVYYSREAKKQTTVAEYAQDILDSRTWMDHHIYSIGWLGPLLGILILWFLLGRHYGYLIGIPYALLAGAIHTFLYVFVLSSSVNGLCHTKHKLGYQNYSDKHAATVFNDWLVALFTGGEGFHHNHHWKQSIARFGHRWWEVAIDGGWHLICVLRFLRLAYDVKGYKAAPPS